MSLKKCMLPGIILILFLGLTVSYSNSSINDTNNSLFQVSTMNSLSAGNFDGILSAGELKKYGDTGSGTFEGLDGEMIELNGVIYHIKSDGKVYIPNDSEKVPYSVVTDFKVNKVLFINESMNYVELQQYINSTLPSKGLVYAIKIIGNFDYIKVRSPQEQNKPYPNLTEALKTQGIFNLNNVNGTMIGFWYPSSASSININDYHFHFINDERNAGGHVLDLKLKNVIVEIDYISDIYLFSPEKNDFYKFNLTHT